MMNKYTTRGAWKNVVPGWEIVTYGARDAEDDLASFGGVSVRGKRRPLSTQELNTGALAVTSEPTVIWELWLEWTDASSITTPKIGDKITDSDGIVWLIQQVDIKLFSNVFDCYCRKQTQ